MYFESKINLTPKNDIQIEKKVPTKVFGKFLHALTLGAVSEKEQHITKRAVTILQNLNIALMKMKITNIIHLSKDGHDFYFDDSGKDNDLKEAMQHFKSENSDLSADLFKTLNLVVEHEDEDLKYLIEININRITQPGVNPINITINGLMKIFDTKNENTNIKDKMKPIFAKTNTNQMFVENHKNQFYNFVEQLTVEIKKVIPCDKVSQISKSRIFKQAPLFKTGHRSSTGPIFTRGYYGYDYSSAYIWSWMDMLEENNIETDTVDFLDGYGASLISTNNDLDDISNREIEDNEASSWLDSSDSSSDSSDNTMSSCSSCSSCGGD